MSGPGSGDIKSATDKWVGTPYLFGGTTHNGVDCSAFTQAAWKSQGVSIPRTAQSQFDALPVAKADSHRYGDLVFFHNDAVHDGITHVAMIIGQASDGTPLLRQATGKGGVHDESLGAYLKRSSGSKVVGYRRPKG